MTGIIKCWEHEIRDPDCPKCASEATPSPPTAELKPAREAAILRICDVIQDIDMDLWINAAMPAGERWEVATKLYEALRTPPATGEGERFGDPTPQQIARLPRWARWHIRSLRDQLSTRASPDQEVERIVAWLRDPRQTAFWPPLNRVDIADAIERGDYRND